MFGNILIILGVLGLLAVGVGYVLTNPDMVKQLRETVRQSMNSAQKSKAELAGLKADLRGGERVPSDAPVSEQFDDIRCGEMAEIKLAVSAALVEMKATGVGIFGALNREPGTQNYSPRGENWLVKFFDDSLLVIHRPEGYYGFQVQKRYALAPEGAHIFNVAGETFSDPPYNQTARSYKFDDWESTPITVLDVGYVEVDTSEGDLPATDGMKIKYLLGETSRRGLVFAQNNFINTDFVWTGGVYLGESVKPFVGKMIRATA